MSATNGTAALTVLELGDVTPDIRPVRIVRDGRGQMLDAYPEGPTCPGSVRSKVQKALARYRAAVFSDGPPGEDGQPTRVFTYDEEAWAAHLRDLLAAIIPGLGPEGADVLSGDTDRALRILEDLGWRERTPDEGEVADPNGPGEGSTTGRSSRDSRRRTGSGRKRS